MRYTSELPITIVDPRTGLTRKLTKSEFENLRKWRRQYNARLRVALREAGVGE